MTHTELAQILNDKALPAYKAMLDKLNGFIPENIYILGLYQLLRQHELHLGICHYMLYKHNINIYWNIYYLNHINYICITPEKCDNVKQIITTFTTRIAWMEDFIQKHLNN